jgi:hypothetical protein
MRQDVIGMGMGTSVVGILNKPVVVSIIYELENSGIQEHEIEKPPPLAPVLLPVPFIAFLLFGPLSLTFHSSWRS